MKRAVEGARARESTAMGTKKSSTVRDASRGRATTGKTTRKTTTKMHAGGGGSMKTKPGDGDATDARARGDEETTRRRSATTTTTTTDAVEDDDFDVDALFGKAKKRMKSEKRRRGRGGEEEEARVRVLLPGQKKPKQRRTTPEFVPVEKARRFEDGLPVYKSCGDFTRHIVHGREGGGGWKGEKTRTERRTGGRLSLRLLVLLLDEGASEGRGGCELACVPVPFVCITVMDVSVEKIAPGCVTTPSRRPATLNPNSFGSPSTRRTAC